MVTFSEGIEVKQVKAVLAGRSFFSSLFLSWFGGQSLSITRVQNMNLENISDVMLAPQDPGGVILHALGSGNNSLGDLLLTSGAYVASDAGITISNKLQLRLKSSLLSGTGLFLLRASGSGYVACAAYGSIHRYELKEGEIRAVDNGNLVAWSADMAYRVGQANRGGFIASMTSGEGLMCHFRGPGTIYLQSHRPGDADTVFKRKKSGARTVCKRGCAASTCGVVSLVLFFVLVLAPLVSLTANVNAILNFVGDYSTRYDNGFDGGYPSSRRSNRKSLKTIGEL